mmetsp:Transcript_1915/g.5517  ORF Transcript_1915/g.5517 Transcript_1915/m.5517 type:complete len:316 (+) Transcript_1915:2699-3646(+)
MLFPREWLTALHGLRFLCADLQRLHPAPRLHHFLSSVYQHLQPALRSISRRGLPQRIKLALLDMVLFFYDPDHDYRVKSRDRNPRLGLRAGARLCGGPRARATHYWERLCRVARAAAGHALKEWRARHGGGIRILLEARAVGGGVCGRSSAEPLAGLPRPRVAAWQGCGAAAARRCQAGARRCRRWWRQAARAEACRVDARADAVAPPGGNGTASGGPADGRRERRQRRRGGRRDAAAGGRGPRRDAERPGGHTAHAAGHGGADAAAGGADAGAHRGRASRALALLACGRRFVTGSIAQRGESCVCVQIGFRTMD